MLFGDFTHMESFLFFFFFKYFCPQSTIPHYHVLTTLLRFSDSIIKMCRKKATLADIFHPAVALKPCFNPCLIQPAFLLAFNVTHYLKAPGHKTAEWPEDSQQHQMLLRKHFIPD